MDRQEYRSRIAALGKSLRDARMDGIVLSSEYNVDYYAGFRHHAPWSLFARPYFLLMNADGRSALVAHGFLADEIRKTGAVEDLRVYTRSGTAPMSLISETMRELGISRGRIGAELGYEQRLGMSWEDFSALRDAHPQAPFVDASELIWRQRMLKSPAEIALLRKAAEITERAFEACFAAARPGTSERELAAIAAETMIREGADRPGFVLIVSGAGNYRRLSGKPSDRKLAAGDMLWIDMGAIYQGYWADFCRAAVIGKPSAEQLATQDVLLEVNQACIDAIRPGAAMKTVAAAAEKRFRARGFDISVGQGRIGHGMGLMATEPPHVALYDETIMEERLFFTIEPRVIKDYGVFNCEEGLVVTAAGAELITTAPRALTVID